MATAKTQAKDKPATETPAVEMVDSETAGQDVAVTGQGQAMSPAQRRKHDTEKFLEGLAQRRSDFEAFLAAHGIGFDFFVAVVKRSLIKEPKLILCTPASLMQACLNCAADGLMPDGREAVITPFKDRKASGAAGVDVYIATYVPMFQGLLKVAYKATDSHGNFLFKDVEVDVIYESELKDFDYRRGDEGYIHFNPPLDRNIEEPIVGAYCIVRTTVGGIFREVIGGKELKKIAAVNKAQFGPGKDWPGEMAKKAPIRRIWKKLPRNAAMDALSVRDEDSYLAAPAKPATGATAIPNENVFDDKVYDGDKAEDPKAITQGGDEAIDVEDDVTPLQSARQLLVECSEISEIDETMAYMRAAPEYAELTDEDWAGLEENAGIMKDRLGGEPTPTPEEEAIARHSESGGTGVVPADVIDGDTGEVLAEGGEPVEEPHEEGHAAPGEIYLMVGDVVGPDKKTPSYKDGKSFSRVGEVGGRSLKIYAIHAPEIVVAPEPDAPAQASDPQIRTNPENRVEIDDGKDPFDDDDAPATTPAPAPVQTQVSPGVTMAKDEPAAPAQPAQEPDGGYGEEEAAAAPAITVLRARFSIQGGPKEYGLEDAMMWRDDILNKMSAFKESALPKWWADNVGFVEEAIPVAREQAGRILAVAVTKRLPGAGDLIKAHGPF
jgi:recombinational DNA repair protein RecT